MAEREWTDQELFNIASPELRPDPYPAYEELRRRGAVLENPMYGVWMVLGYDTVEQVLNAPDAFSNVFDGDPIASFLRIRRTTRDVEIAGAKIPAESRVLVIVAAANRDPRTFEAPDRLDVGRANAKLHLGFGSGIHFCIGAALARLEGRIALASLLKIAPDYALGADAGREYGPSFILRGLSRLPVAMRP